MSNALGRLVIWKSSVCDGDWEHQHGISISTIDNPGWAMDVDLNETVWADMVFGEVIEHMETDDKWLHCKFINGVFKGRCALNRLEDMICVFLEFVERRGEGP